MKGNVDGQKKVSHKQMKFSKYSASKIKPMQGSLKQTKHQV